jgi:hypothetical protein
LTVKLTAVVVATLAMAACAGQADQQYISSAKAYADPQVVAQCEYESLAASKAGGYSARTLIGQVYEEKLRKDEIMAACLKAKAYQPVQVASPVRHISAVPVKMAEPVVTKDAETAKVVQVLADNGFPLVGEPVRFKQKGNLTFYEARGTGGRLTQVVCESGVCRSRTIND